MEVNIPNLMKEIAHCVKVQCDNELDEFAIYNIFLARFASAIATKNILTFSCRHAEEKPLAYYGLNFIPSGGNKDKPFTIIQNMFNWLNGEYEKQNNELRNRFIDKCKLALATEKRSDSKELAKIEEKASKLPKLKARINGATEQKIYQICENIAKYGFGSLFFYDTEFVNKFEKSNKVGNYDNTLSSIYNLYEGCPDFTDTTLTDRNTIEKISCSVCFSSDFGKMLRNKKLNDAFKEYLSGGFARRTYIYTSSVTNALKMDVKYPELDERMLEQNKIPRFAEELKSIYDRVRGENIYKFSFKANQRIEKYHQNMKKYVKEQFSFADVLPIEDEILKVDLQGSTWKIVKTAFLFHLMMYPELLEVKTDSVNMAIDYYQSFNKFLPLLLNKKSLDSVAKFKIFVYKNLDKELKLNSEIREALEIHPTKWKHFKNELLTDILDELQNEGIFTTENKKGKTEYLKFYKKEQIVDDLEL